MGKALRKKANLAGVSPYIGCMLAQEFDEKRVKYPVAVEDKLDGIRITFVDGKGYTRNGKTYESLDYFAGLLQQVVAPGVHVDTEVMGRNWNETSKLIKRVKNVDHEAIRKNVTVWVFDVYSSRTVGRGVTYKSRREEVLSIVQSTRGLGDGFEFEPVTQTIAKNRREVDYHLQQALQRGREGVMVKPLDGDYFCKRAFCWLKLKPFRDITLTIVGAEEGRGKCPRCSTVEAKRARFIKMYGNSGAANRMKLEELEKVVPAPLKNCRQCAGVGEVAKAGVLGAFLCKDEKGNDVKVGGGFTQEQRVDFWKRRKHLVNMKIDVKVQDESGNDIVARFPVFRRFRSDLQ